MQAEFSTHASNLNKGNYDKLYDFIERYSKENGYDYVFSRGFGGEMLYGNDMYDLTDEVIEGLNREYKELMESDSSDTDTE